MVGARRGLGSRPARSATDGVGRRGSGGGGGKGVLRQLRDPVAHCTCRSDSLQPSARGSTVDGGLGGVAASSRVWRVVGGALNGINTLSAAEVEEVVERVIDRSEKSGGKQDGRVNKTNLAHCCDCLKSPNK